MEIYNSFQTSVKKALDEIDSDWPKYKGLIICGTHSPKNVEELIIKIKEARESETPFLGICFGHQLAAIEYARNVLGIKDATSEEFGKCYSCGSFGYLVSRSSFGIFENWPDSPEFTRRKCPDCDGKSKTFVVKKRLEGLNVGLKDGESYCNNYEVAIDWQKPEWFFTTQSHPEYQSSIDRPHSLLVQFLEYARS